MLVDEQMNILGSYPDSFGTKIRIGTDAKNPLTGLTLTTFQINVGKWCNQACKHCHVDASPIRTEMMTRETIDKCLSIIKSVPEIQTVDITGGAPEGNIHFRYLVEEVRKLDKKIIDRCNLTILEEKGNEDLHEFLAANDVEICSSLPYFSQSRTDQQRGDGVFNKSITALQKLNKLGYGIRLPLNLVYNPVGVFLSSAQKQLEREFKENLDKKYGIVFNNLYCINNMPINRYLGALVRTGKFETYMETLVNAYNPMTLEGLMCRHQISVGYDGKIYDCDFNQMLELEAKPVSHINNFDYETFVNRNIVVANHCFGCTAGAGSSCGGEVA
ncbi:arsenosugar biosynthesis radical SAM (seleno)protein ArsS [Leptospira ilyithenensis]|uniref:Radical SAM/Cys-rich domain protein n=1 Tax=Leptospira ilyithenensis TaxID=2484901 RepID=A0A4R9LPH3_9LEPT|nr:arsenosugar biosynthesis radical SAM (seleno)protein ArsS [Leptospira ilyithenensis]TGN08714.1 radical SAM/Cys-rich domain protein [Leptospira ilyithenensis]